MLILAPPSEGKSSENFVNVKFNETDFNKIISKFNKVKRNFGNI